MVKAWLALDAAATAAGKAPLSPLVWEVPLGSDLGLAAIVPSDDHAAAVRAEGRQVTVYTLEEIARFLVGLLERPERFLEGFRLCVFFSLVSLSSITDYDYSVIISEIAK